MPSRVKGDGRTTRWDAHRDQRRTELVQAAVRAIDDESRSGGKRPSHRYSLADYGLTESQVRDAFGG